MGFHAWILKLIHIALTLVRCVWRTRAKLSGVAASWTSGGGYGGGSKPLLMQQLVGAAQLKKPSHLGVIVLEESVSYADLANIVVWSRTYGIACVTLYNPAGSSNLDASRLNAAISQAAAKSGSCCAAVAAQHYSIRAVDYYYSSDSSSKKAALLAAAHSDDQRAAAAASDRSNGVCSPVKCRAPDRCGATAAAAMQILLLPRIDGGHGLLVAAALARGPAMALARRRRHAQSGGSGDSAVATPNLSTPESLLEDELTSRLPVSCPEAVLQFGDVTSLCGYLPWHVRLTEIFTLLTHVNMRQREFLRVMQLYGSTEQRLGT